MQIAAGMPRRLAEYEPGCCLREKEGDGSIAYRTVHEWNMLAEQSAGAVEHALSPWDLRTEIGKISRKDAKAQREEGER
jgi:hypothetical protein